VSMQYVNLSTTGSLKPGLGFRFLGVFSPGPTRNVARMHGAHADLCSEKPDYSNHVVFQEEHHRGSETARQETPSTSYSTKTSTTPGRPRRILSKHDLKELSTHDTTTSRTSPPPPLSSNILHDQPASVSFHSTERSFDLRVRERYSPAPWGLGSCGWSQED